MKNQNYEKVIAIDGPSGSGKSTVAKMLAENLGVLYIDTGSMFRALAYECDKRGIDFSEGPQLSDFLKSIHLEYGVNENTLIQIDKVNLTDKIREHHVSALASIISQLPSVRSFLLDFQRNLAKDRICVMEGRDIGTVVFPKSFAKFFITASVETRADRRFKQLLQNGDCSKSLEQIQEDVRKRDESDINRTHAPLKKAEDAMEFDTTNLSLTEIVNLLSNEIKFRANDLGYKI